MCGVKVCVWVHVKVCVCVWCEGVCVCGVKVCVWVHVKVCMCEGMCATQPTSVTLVRKHTWLVVTVSLQI